MVKHYYEPSTGGWTALSRLTARGRARACALNVKSATTAQDVFIFDMAGVTREVDERDRFNKIRSNPQHVYIVQVWRTLVMVEADRSTVIFRV